MRCNRRGSIALRILITVPGQSGVKSQKMERVLSNSTLARPATSLSDQKGNDVVCVELFRTGRVASPAAPVSKQKRAEERMLLGALRSLADYLR